MSEALFIEIDPGEYQPAGDVTRVSIVPIKVTGKIGNAENR